MGVVREPLAVLLGLLAFACSTGAAWQAGLAWPAAAKRPLARVTSALAVVLAAFGFSLGYWEVLSGVGDLLYRFSAPTIHALFDIAAIGLPLAVLGLVLGVVSTIHAADVPAKAVVPAILAGAAIGWLLDPYGLIAGPRMGPVRARYADAASTAGLRGGYSGSPAAGNLFDNWSPSFPGGDGSGSHGDGGDGNGDGSSGAIVLLLIALAVLAVAGGVITAALVFSAGRKKAKAQLARAGG